MVRAKEVKALDNFFLLIRFDNDEVKMFNCSSLMQDRLFHKLRDKDFFDKVHIDDMGLVCWDESTDINPYELYEQSESIAE